MLKEEFLEISAGYSTEKNAHRLWGEIEVQYSKKERFYHTVHHLENLYDQLKPYQNQFSNWQTIIFSIVYHDLIYDVFKNNNEELSADYGEERLLNLKFPENEVAKCKEIILATRSHASLNKEADFFTDADLSILGSSEADYKIYREQIRKEYYPFPDIIYNPGRKKVLEHFIHMDHIYKTEDFAGRYEAQARKNLKAEIESLR